MRLMRKSKTAVKKLRAREFFSLEELLPGYLAADDLDIMLSVDDLIDDPKLMFLEDELLGDALVAEEEEEEETPILIAFGDELQEEEEESIDISMSCFQEWVSNLFDD